VITMAANSLRADRRQALGEIGEADRQRVDAAGDHRIAMLGAVAGVCSQEGVTIAGADALAVSFPDFAERLAAVSA